MTASFSGRAVVVTGAAKGIGRACAEMFAARGADVLAVDREESAAPLSGVTAITADLADRAVLSELADRVEAAPGTDVLVNAAAAYSSTDDLFDTTVDDWVGVLDVNVVALGVLATAMARGLDRRRVPDDRRGSVVNFCSVQEYLPVVGYGPYVASKGAVRGLTRSLAVDLGRAGVRVNAVAPGVVNTPSMAGTLGGALWGDTDPPPTLLGRAGTSDEVAEVVAFLASDAASFITGAVLPVDGGRRLSRRHDPLGEQ